MTADDITVGPWAQEKLHALESYLIEYTKIMRRQQWCKGYVYVDAFAGPGTHILRGQSDRRDNDFQVPLLSDYQVESNELAEFIRGSPRVALDLPNPFTVYVFVERNPTRVEALERLRQEYKGRREIRVRNQDCNDYLRTFFIVNPRIDWKEWRAVVFLDPFGMQVPWNTIEGLAQTGAVELLINFPVGMAIQRMLRRDGQLSDAMRKKLDRYFGDSDWYDVVYKTDASLFGNDLVKTERSGHALVRWYRQRLHTVFKHVTKARLVRNSHGGHLYYLIHAGQNATGGRIAGYILNKGEIVN